MREIKLDVNFKVYPSVDNLEESVKALMLKAVEARKKAYAPYSKFRVGAAILLANGEVVTGSNQENAAYPSGLCAERTAIFYAGANYPDEKIIAIAVSACSDLKVTKGPIPPCGACRQSMFEYEVKQEQSIKLFCMGGEGEVVESNSIGNILPFHFDKSVL
nr:cytidine deaminase [uncultured Flavobacterium sp.]